jgi:hypothetical protein
MQTVQLLALDHTGRTLFYTLGMGMSYASAKASAMVGMRARLSADRKVSSRVSDLVAEVL